MRERGLGAKGFFLTGSFKFPVVRAVGVVPEGAAKAAKGSY